MDKVPPFGQEVIATLADGVELLAYWSGTGWMMGVEDDSIDATVSGEVIAWRWRDS